MPSELVGVAGFEPAASSSRSQVAIPVSRVAVSLTWERLSVSVRWRPPLAVAIVTQLVTRLRAGSSLTIWMQTTGVALLVVERCSPVSMRMPAWGGLSAYGLLYLAAVRDYRPGVRTLSRSR
jgi:hypothetical protein